jgi:hypothetical protein
MHTVLSLEHLRKRHLYKSQVFQNLTVKKCSLCLAQIPHVLRILVSPDFFFSIFFRTSVSTEYNMGFLFVCLFICLGFFYLQTRPFTYGHIITPAWCRPHSYWWRGIQQHSSSSIISTHAYYSISYLKGTGMFWNVSYTPNTIIWKDWEDY